MYKYVNGKKIKLSAQEISARETESREAKEHIAKTKYKLDRSKAYPTVAEQLDTIYHKGIDVWKAEIKAIKDKHPKPSEE